MSDPASTLDRLTARAGQLYSLPAVAMKVLKLTSNPQVDTRALKECIENDPALTGKILRVVNSSLFGLSREVSDLNQALALLGTKPLKMLVLGFSLPAGLFENVAGEILGWYWRHTLTKAVAGREISETLFNTPGDDAFIAGLLQDLGILLLIQEVGEPYIRFLEKVQVSGKDLAALETESIGFDHTTLSARLLAHWGLPEMLVEAVTWEAAQRQSKAPPPARQALPQILHLAELLARLLADGQSGVLSELLEARKGQQNLAKSQLETLVGNLEEKVRQLAEVLSLQLPDGLDYRDVLVQAHTQLARVAGEAAEDLVRSQQREASLPDEDLLLKELRSLAKEVAEAARRPVESGGRVGFASPAPNPAAGPEPTATMNPRPGASATTAADPGLFGQLTVAVAACRQSRCSLSLLLVEFDRADELLTTRGVEGFGKLQRFLETICMNLDHPCAMCAAHGDAGFALILPDCERRLAVQLGNQLMEEVRGLAPGSGDPNRGTVSISVGVATVLLPPKNFPPQDLFTSADRCLYGSHASGGGVVKSIEIY